MREFCFANFVFLLKLFYISMIDFQLTFEICIYLYMQI